MISLCSQPAQCPFCREYFLDAITAIGEAEALDPTDEALMLAYAAGDSAAFSQLYARHKTSLYSYFLHHTRQAALANDLFQDVWMRIVEQRHRYVASAPFRHFLFRVAHNRLMDHFRQHRPATELSPEHMDAAPTPEQRVAGELELERVADILQNLPLEQREAVVLRSEGFALDEIADIQGVGRETVKSRLRYALARLRQGREHD